ncbi:metallophosphoesterase [Candidatus Babeliales bacterium]|nr:metallophosphoesterase [Candidatus Babeliales bacterium]
MEKSNKSKMIGKVITIASIGILGFVVLSFITQDLEQTTGFENIRAIVSDAASKEEFILPDNFKADAIETYKNPTWNKYHAKTNKSFLKKKGEDLLYLFGLQRKPSWSPSYFRNLLEQQVGVQQVVGREAEYVVQLKPDNNDRFIIFGDLHGAYHSLTRCLQKLVSLKILSKNLKLTSHQDHIVFMGDAVNRSPFVAETVSIIARLQESNPRNVWYLGGNAEHNDRWQQYISGVTPLLTSTIKNYFRTLPLGLYLNIPSQSTHDFVRISHFGRKQCSHEKYQHLTDLLDDSHFADSLVKNEQQEYPKIIKVQGEAYEQANNSINVKAIIKSIFKSKTYDKKSKGLQLLAKDGDSTAWSVLSCPTAVHSRFLGINNDAFAILQVASQLNDWTLVHYYRNVRAKNDFKTKVYNLISGKRVA